MSRDTFFDVILLPYKYNIINLPPKSSGMKKDDLKKEYIKI